MATGELLRAEPAGGQYAGALQPSGGRLLCPWALLSCRAHGTIGRCINALLTDQHLAA